MKTIFMVCRSEKETPHEFVRLMETLFPECEVRIVYESRPKALPEVKSAFSPFKMEGL